MAASATMDPMVTVKQHGFVVKEGPPVFQRLSPSSDARLREESTTGSGLSRVSLGLINSRTVTPPPVAPLGGAVDYGVSPGLPKAGDVRPAEYTHLTPGVKRLMRSVMRGLKAHQDPEAATEGLGGTYFFRNEAGVKIAIMKPCDEEPLAPNNPKGFVGRQLGEPGLKPTVRVGEAASREVAAYLLDHDHFARVPHTVMVRMSHPVFHIANTNSAEDKAQDDDLDRCESSDPAMVDVNDEDDALPLKLGSLQEYAPHECDTSELGASRFNVKDVQRIGILDIRLFNTDRHAGNILVRRARPSHAADGTTPLADLHLKDPYELIPIDHGFALPEALEPPYFEWQHWPQALMPFGQEELEYIAKLDPRADSDLLRRELPGLKEESLRLLEVSTTLLKRCAAAGLSLSEIAGVVTRPLIGLDDEPSELEKLCDSVRQEMDAGLDAFEEESSDEDDDVLAPLEETEEEEELEEEEAAAVDAGAHDEDLSSPGAQSAASTHFQFDNEEEPRPANTDSDASRQTVSMDDALFSMDEDGAGARTPMAASPDGYPMPSRMPSLVVKRTGELATPSGVVGISFGSGLASADSLPASYDSDGSPTASAGANASRLDSLDSTEGPSVAAAFTMAASFVPGGYASAAKPANRRTKGGQHRRHRVGGGRAGRKAARAQAYPPLVQPRCTTCAGANGVFSGLSKEEWDQFLHVFEDRVDEALESGLWSQSSLGGMNGPGPLMSCPKF